MALVHCTRISHASARKRDPSCTPCRLFRTHALSRIGGWRGIALAALFPPPSWRTDRTSFQVVGSPVSASFPLASAHFASPHQVQAVPLSPLALRLAFPALPAGRHSCDSDGDSVPLRLAPGRGSHVPSR